MQMKGSQSEGSLSAAQIRVWLIMFSPWDCLVKGDWARRHRSPGREMYCYKFCSYMSNIKKIIGFCSKCISNIRAYNWKLICSVQYLMRGQAQTFKFKTLLHTVTYHTYSNDKTKEKRIYWYNLASSQHHFTPVLGLWSGVKPGCLLLGGRAARLTNKWGSWW